MGYSGVEMATELDDTRPPYLQILEDLRDAITSGSIAPGDKVPSNADLKRKYGVASQTAQNAINALKSEGIVYGVAGRGVFVRSDLDIESLRKSTKPEQRTEATSNEEIAHQVEELTNKVKSLEDRIAALESQDP